MDNRFEIVTYQDLHVKGMGGISYVEILRDKETGAMYLYRNVQSGGGLTVLLDKDGQPAISQQTVSETTQKSVDSAVKTNAPIISQEATESDVPAPSILDFGDLQWQVLATEGNKSLIITVDILNEQPLDENSESEVVLWMNCTLRSYLNSAFLQNFSSNELEQIAETAHTEGAYSTDRIFLLSANEAEEYFADNVTRIGRINNENTCWWLRSQGEGAINAAIVDDSGSVDREGQCVDFSCGIRPAMWITTN